MTLPRNQEFFTEPEPQPKKRWWHWRRYRSAKTGQYVRKQPPAPQRSPTDGMTEEEQQVYLRGVAAAIGYAE